jgi:hypothetical protein
MTVSRTVNLPASHRLVIDVPREVPEGPIVLSFTPMSETDMIEFTDATAEEVLTVGGEILDKHIAAFKALAN